MTNTAPAKQLATWAIVIGGAWAVFVALWWVVGLRSLLVALGVGGFVAWLSWAWKRAARYEAEQDQLARQNDLALRRRLNATLMKAKRDGAI